MEKPQTEERGISLAFFCDRAAHNGPPVGLSFLLKLPAHYCFIDRANKEADE